MPVGYPMLGMTLHLSAAPSSTRKSRRPKNCKSAMVILGLALMFGAIAQIDYARAQERLRIAWAGGASNAAVWIVQEKGLLKKQGVNAEFISVNASPMALQAMIAGEVDVIVTSVTTLVNSRLTGADVVMILAIVP